MGIESIPIAFLGAAGLPAPAASTAPEEWPASFYTVERTGGAGDFRMDRPTVAVQAWAPTLAEAERLIAAADRAILAGLADGAPVTSCRRVGLARFPVDGKPRYQALYSITMYA